VSIARAIARPIASAIASRTTAIGGGGSPAPEPFAPATLSPSLWFRAQAESYANDAPVTQWNDISGNLRHITEATNPPTFKTAVNNSRAAVLFDGSADRLVGSFSGGGTAWTIAGIAESASATGLQVWLSGSSSFYLSKLATTELHRIRIGAINTDSLYAFRDWFPVLIRANGTLLEVFDGQNRIAVGTIVASQLLFEGLSNRSTFFWNGHIQEVFAKNTALSDSDASSLVGYLLTESGKTDEQMIVCDGDSLTFGLRSTGGLTYPAQLETLYGATVARTLNYGVSGQTLVAMQSDAVAQIDRYAKRLDAVKPTLVAWGGTNDINTGADSATALVSLATYCSGRKSAGFRVVVCTMIARGSFDATQNTYRDEFNASVRTNYLDYADDLCDLALDARLANVADTAYFDADTVHLNNTGYGVVAELVKAIIDS
jgi:lysophospholipase L1-like esterase